MMSRDRYELPVGVDSKDPNGSGEADFEELNLPEVPSKAEILGQFGNDGNQVQMSSATFERLNDSTMGDIKCVASAGPARNGMRGSNLNAASNSSEDDLFNTYRKFLQESTENLHMVKGALPLHSTAEDAANYMKTPNKKRRKSGARATPADTPRNIEKECNLWYRVQVPPDQVDSVVSFLRDPENLNSFIETSADGFKVKAPIDFDAFKYIKTGDVLTMLNAQNFETFDMDGLLARINRPMDCLEMAFRCSRRLRLAKMSRLKGDLIEPEALNDIVESLGGYTKVNEKKMWQSVREKLGLQFTTSSSHQLKNSYLHYFTGVIV